MKFCQQVLLNQSSFLLIHYTILEFHLLAGFQNQDQAHSPKAKEKCKPPYRTWCSQDPGQILVSIDSIACPIQVQGEGDHDPWRKDISTEDCERIEGGKLISSSFESYSSNSWLNFCRIIVVIVDIIVMEQGHF